MKQEAVGVLNSLMKWGVFITCGDVDGPLGHGPFLGSSETHFPA